MPYIPTKRCDKLIKHDEHVWKEDKAFKRWCPGRTTTKLPSRREREQHPRNNR